MCFVVHDERRTRAVRAALPDLRTQVHDETLRGLLADTGRARESRGVTGRDRGRDLRRARDRQDRHRALRSDARHADEHLEERELLPRLEAVERLRVLADHVMRVEEHVVARRMPRNEDLVAHAAHVDDDVIAAARDYRPADRRDHGSSRRRVEGPAGAARGRGGPGPRGAPPPTPGCCPGPPPVLWGPPPAPAPPPPPPPPP